MWSFIGLHVTAFVLLASAQEDIPRVAVIATVWRHNAHADVIGSRLVQGYTLDGQGEFPKLKLVSAYVDQFPANDMSRRLAAEHGFTIYDSVAGALTLGGEKLAVDGVLLICEHGDYPRSATGSVEYPKRRLFGQIVRVFEASGRVVPVFSDKHLEDDWADIAWFYGEAQRLRIPLMAGSSLPTLWRYPEADIDRAQEFRKCIECFLCQDVCHVLRDHHKHEQFIGPRFFVYSAALEMHPLDTEDRLRDLKEDQAIGYCNITRCCTTVCPEHITITDNAIIPLKERVVDEFYDPVVKLVRLARGRK